MGLDDLIESGSIKELIQRAAEIRQEETEVQQRITELQRATARKSLTARLDKIVARIDAMGDPRIYREFERYAGKYHIPRRGSRRVSEEKEPWNVFDERRPRIKDLVYRLADEPAHSGTVSRGVPTQYFIDNVPELKKEGLVKNARALSGYFKSIMQEPSSRLKRKSKGLYVVSPVLTSEQVYRMADRVYEKKKVISYLDIEGNPRSIGAYLAIWAQERGMKSEVVSMGKEFHQVTIYFKGKRPPVTPKELVAKYVGNKKKVSHSSIVKATGLENRAVLTLMTGVFGYKFEGSGTNRMYY